MLEGSVVRSTHANSPHLCTRIHTPSNACMSYNTNVTLLLLAQDATDLRRVSLRSSVRVAVGFVQWLDWCT